MEIQLRSESRRGGVKSSLPTGARSFLPERLDLKSTASDSMQCAYSPFQ